MLWDEVTKIIKENISKQNYETWIKPVRVKSIEEGMISLYVPNRFFREWLEENYLFLIKDAIRLETGNIYDVDFIIDNENIPQNASSIKNDVLNTDIKKDLKTQKKKVHPTLNVHYSFERFVIGPSNQFAHAAAYAVAEQPAKNYNPLFIYGGVGLGKTHLINSIGLKTLSIYPNMNVIYVSAEVFMNDLINSIRFDKMQAFREKFRNIDCLLIDDIQFIAGKERTQEEFFHTFNTLHDSGKQIVVTSDKFPKDIPNLESRLRSRFEWGLIADIQPPEIETRIAILEKKAGENNVALPENVALFLASQSESNIRELEGYLIRISAYSSLTKRSIDIDLAKEVLKQLIYKDDKKDINIEDIIKITCSQLGLKVSEIKSHKKNKNLVEARQIIMFMAREITNLSFPDIGESIGGRDHSTVIYSCNKIKKRLQTEKTLNETVEKIRDIVINKK
jgi:chromosomal replication initiator protein